MEFKKFFVYPKFPEELEKLVTISSNLWFTWDFEALSLFYKMDAELFRKVKHNPIKFIHLLPKEKIDALARDKKFLDDLQEIWERFESYQKKTISNGDSLGITKEDLIAYFSAEIALHEALPVYAGGLGVLAGDILMGASDLDIPLIGVTLLYNKGYFKQVIDQAGVQKEEMEKFDKFLNILREVKGDDQKPLIIDLRILDQVVKVKVWKVEIGRRVAIFLDTDLPENSSEIRSILDYLYPADAEKRLKQEIILGMGGYEALKKMKLEPKIYHLNEGHSAFVILSRLKDLMQERGLSFDEAKLYIQETTIFTTHTPVIAGNEHFDMKLIEKYLSSELASLGLSIEDIMKCGCILGDRTLFWLPAMAIRFSRYVNAVAQIHQEVTKKMWQPLFEEWLPEEVPIDYVTNGVHWRWLSEPFDDLLKRYVDPDYRFLGPEDSAWEEILNIPEEEVWEAHKKNKQKLINLLNKILEEEIARGDIPRTAREWSLPLKRFTLIVGFARRVTGYKRNNLILFDKERLLKLLKDKDRPLLFVVAGKAHPKDLEGKKMIQELLEFRKKYQVEDKFIFLENYDLHLARYILWGSDVWLNTPYRPMEASGTSGMKAAMNGVLHLSVLDGWWAEGYEGNNGWAIFPKEGLPPYNYYEANQIYTLLEGEIKDLYYQRDEEGIPREWVRRMKRAIYTACKRFSINRVLLEYAQKLYSPSLKQLKLLSADNFALLKSFSEESKLLRKLWNRIQILRFDTNLTSEALWEETEIEIMAEVDMGEIPENLVRVELVCIRESGLEEDKTNKEIELIPLKAESRVDSRVTYRIRYHLYGHGLRKIGIRVVPANEIIRRAYPELIKWY